MGKGGLRGKLDPDVNSRPSRMLSPSVSLRRPPTLNNRLQRLEHKVNRIKPEIQEFRVNRTTLTSLNALYSNEVDFSPTENLRDDSTFRDRVTGDKWMSKGLLLRWFNDDGQVYVNRVVIYMPSRAGSSWAASTNGNYSDIPDSTAFKVLFDQTYTQKFALEYLNGKIYIPINRICMVNSDGTGDPIDKGNLRVKMYWGSGVGTTNMEYAYSYFFHNM